MYTVQGDEEVLQQDLLNSIAAHAGENAEIVISSGPFPSVDEVGANPPHVIARNRYQELVEEVHCTGEYPSVEAPEPIVYVIGQDGFERLPLESESGDGDKVSLSAVAAAGAVLGGVAAIIAAARRSGQPREPRQAGLDTARQAVERTRQGEAAPRQPVGFGSR